MFEDLKENISHEKKILKDINSINESLGDDPRNKTLYTSSLNSLISQFSLINKNIPELLEEWSPVKNSESIKNNLGKNKISEKKSIKMNYVSPMNKEKHFLTINKKDKKEFLEKLKLSESNLKRLKKIKLGSPESLVKRPNYFVKFSNKYFGKYSKGLVHKFSGLENDMKKGNIRFLMSTYISMAMMTTLLSFFIGFLIFCSLLLFSLSNLIYFWIPFFLGGLSILSFYLYPSSEAHSVQKGISQELPFVTIHMAAIAGSSITPIKIFKIIAASKEYPNVGNEMRKIVAQIDVYGYDLITALKNVSAKTPNKNLSELFSGLATNIGTGGRLKNYLEKKSNNFLLDYRLERQKYSELAGTFMDIYISILIAAPLVLMMMFIIMNVSGLGMGGLSIELLLFSSVGILILLNIIFIFFLTIKQPSV
tara:strand:- start:1414 stop:2682 length:1269 start_codon:yes stop_codon:yes gene_type:complete